MENIENANRADPGGSLVALPKHIPFPDVPHSSEIVNELVTFIFILSAAAMQFVHIYRTMWWLPDSFMNHTVNIHLIDLYLVLFIIVMISRRLLYSLINKIIEWTNHGNSRKIHKVTARFIFTAIFSVCLGYCVIKIFSRQNYLCLFLLLYPFVMYFLIFGFRAEPLMRITNEIETSYLNGIPMHCCSTNPSAIRDEIEMLKNDFNDRFKQTLFTAVINAYYAGFVPCFFAQNFLYYDVLWATQHIIFVWISGFTMCAVFCFPAKYCDVLHRAALHLGQWTRIDGRLNNNQPPGTWSKSTAWPSSSVIRYNGELYKSNGPITLAIPGNVTHYRFYKLFNNPSIFYMVLTAVQTFLVVLQILLLCFSIEWHNVLSLSFLTLTNHLTLFRLVRDYLVTSESIRGGIFNLRKIKYSFSLVLDNRCFYNDKRIRLNMYKFYFNINCEYKTLRIIRIKANKMDGELEG